MHSHRSPTRLRIEAKAHEAEAEKLRQRAAAIFTSGATRNYSDVNDQYEELCADADAEFTLAMKLYREAHATEHFERERRAA